MKKSLSVQLLDSLKNTGEWTHSVRLEDLARALGYKGSNAGRRLREMYNDGMVEREYIVHDGVRCVWYKYIDTEKTK